MVQTTTDLLAFAITFNANPTREREEQKDIYEVKYIMLACVNLHGVAACQEMVTVFTIV